MKVAITGSSGLIGSALVQAIESQGDTPIRIGRNQTGDIHWDPVADSIDSQSLEDLDAVIHLAGEGIGDKRWTAKQKARILDSRVNGTRLLCTTLAALDKPPKKLLSGSAIGIYGDQGDRELNESDPAGTGFLADVCAQWEKQTQAAQDADIAVTHLRTGIVLAKNGGILKRLLPLYRLGLGGRLGPGDQYMSWISLEDEVAAIIWLLRNDLDGPVNLTSPNPVTNREFNAALARAVHRPARIPVPAFLPKIMFGGELVDGLILASANVSPHRLTDAGFTHAHPNLGLALDQIVAR